MYPCDYSLTAGLASPRPRARRSARLLRETEIRPVRIVRGIRIIGLILRQRPKHRPFAAIGRVPHQLIRHLVRCRPRRRRRYEIIRPAIRIPRRLRRVSPRGQSFPAKQNTKTKKNSAVRNRVKFVFHKSSPCSFKASSTDNTAPRSPTAQSHSIAAHSSQTAREPSSSCSQPKDPSNTPGEVPPPTPARTDSTPIATSPPANKAPYKSETHFPTLPTRPTSSRRTDIRPRQTP